MCYFGTSSVTSVTSALMLMGGAFSCGLGFGVFFSLFCIVKSVSWREPFDRKSAAQFCSSPVIVLNCAQMLEILSSYTSLFIRSETLNQEDEDAIIVQRQLTVQHLAEDASAALAELGSELWPCLLQRLPTGVTWDTSGILGMRLQESEGDKNPVVWTTEVLKMAYGWT